MNEWINQSIIFILLLSKSLSWLNFMSNIVIKFIWPANSSLCSDVYKNNNYYKTAQMLKSFLHSCIAENKFSLHKVQYFIGIFKGHSQNRNPKHDSDRAAQSRVWYRVNTRAPPNFAGTEVCHHAATVSVCKASHILTFGYII